MVERIKIIPSRILLKNASDVNVFDTNNYYLKTDATGSLNAGGYAAPPTVYGGVGASFAGAGGTISDKGNGGFISEMKFGQIPFDQSVVFSVPAYTNAKIVSGWGTQRGLYETQDGVGNKYYSPYKTAQFRNLNNQIVATTSYRWAADIFNYGWIYQWSGNGFDSYIQSDFNDADSVLVLSIENITLPPVTEQGTWEFNPGTLASLDSWLLQGWPANYTLLYYITNYQVYQAINLKKTAIATDKNPVVLSISRTL